MATTRIYAVTGEPKVRLVEATSAAAAVRFVASKVYSATIAKPADIVAAMTAGVTVEKATASEPVAEF